MGRFIIIVLDGFGVGQMPDVEVCRSQDIGSSTAESILSAVPELSLPSLEGLGLMNILGHDSKNMRRVPNAVYGKAMLAHAGADTFFGHQEIAGTRPAGHVESSIAPKMDAIRDLLEAEGYAVETYQGSEGRRLLIVDRALTVADNVECDPGQAYNVTAAIDDMDFEKVMRVGRLVRSVSQVPRVICFGGRGVHIGDILGAIEEHENGFIGVNAPKSGVYREDYHCVHLGCGVDPENQIPTILGRMGIPSLLLGKAADIVQNPYGISQSIVDTDEVLLKTLELVREYKDAFIFANVQQTDLAGHRENARLYAQILMRADEGVARIEKELGGEDVMIVMADHGNDPLIGHPHHTREMVPLRIYSKRARPGCIGIRRTMSDVAATAAEYFRSAPPENGSSMLGLLTGGRQKA